MGKQESKAPRANSSFAIPTPQPWVDSQKKARQEANKVERSCNILDNNKDHGSWASSPSSKTPWAERHITKIRGQGQNVRGLI